jgi:hypothetical protein
MIINPSLRADTAGPKGYSDVIAALTAQKWEMVSEGPSGAQLKQAKAMRLQTKIALVIGVVVLLLVHWIAGAAIAAIALVDFAIQKPRTHFVSRDNPRLP